MKTPRSALVAIPPEEIWEPIQRIRHRFDREVHRWMPHVTLLFPFRPRSEFERILPAIASACSEHSAFELALQEFRWFKHGRAGFTMWLAPDPPTPLRALQTSLDHALPDCDDVSRFPRGFTPHLSVGQARGRHELEERISFARTGWKPLHFTLREVALVARDKDGPFAVVHRVPLGGVGTH
ncbi:MAG: 2'-5' RNA ligase family protein [Planctomycetota bacterium]